MDQNARKHIQAVIYLVQPCSEEWVSQTGKFDHGECRVTWGRILRFHSGSQWMCYAGFQTNQTHPSSVYICLFLRLILCRNWSWILDHYWMLENIHVENRSIFTAQFRHLLLFYQESVRFICKTIFFTTIQLHTFRVKLLTLSPVFDWNVLCNYIWRSTWFFHCIIPLNSYLESIYV